MKLALGQIPENGLTTVPVQPDGAEEQQKQKACTEYSKCAEQAGETAGMDLAVTGRMFELCSPGARSLKGLKSLDGNMFAHDLSLIRLHQA